MIILVNGYGYYNVIRHHDTAKGSWNLPVEEVLNFLSDKKGNCVSNVVFLWDPVFEYHLWKNGFDVAILPGGFRGDVKAVAPNDDRTLSNIEGCDYLLSTTSGTRSKQAFFETDFGFDKPLIEIGFDKLSNIKTFLGVETPQYYVSIYRVSRSTKEAIFPHFNWTHYR